MTMNLEKPKRQDIIHDWKINLKSAWKKKQTIFDLLT